MTMDNFTWTSAEGNSSISTTQIINIPICRVGEPVITIPIPENITKLMNGTMSSYPTWDIALKITLYSLTMIVTILGNFMVILVVALSRKMRTLTNIFVMNLAISDLLVGCLCQLVALGTSIYPVWPFGNFICRTNHFFQVLALIASVFFMTVIAGDRFLAIVHPLGKKLSSEMAIVVIVAVWISAAAVAFPHLFVWELKVLRWHNFDDFYCEENWPKYYIEVPIDGRIHCLSESPQRKVYYVIHVFLLYFLPMVLMLVLYHRIGLTLWKRRLPGEQTDTALLAQQKAKKKVVRMLIGIMVSFAICWTPKQIWWLMDVFKSNNTSTPQWMKSSQFYVTYLAYFNSALNPVLYAGLNENFRRGFLSLIYCSPCKRNKVYPGNAGRWTLTVGNTASIK